MLKINDIVMRELGGQQMKIIALDPELVENVITEWEDEAGNIFTGKFIEAELHKVE